MVDRLLAARSAITQTFPLAAPHLRLEACDNLTLASLAPANGKNGELRLAIRERFGVDLPDTPRRIDGENIAFLWFGPLRWLAVAEHADDRDLERELRPLLSGLAFVADLTDSRAVFRISGGHARDVLAKVAPIDLHSRAFKPGDVALTHAHHIEMTLWQRDDSPTFEIAVPRSYAESFAAWLRAAAAEFLSQ